MKDNFKAELWSKEIVRQTEMASVFSGLVVRDYEGKVENQMDTVHVPVIINAKIVSFKEVIISKHKYFEIRVPDIEATQSDPVDLSSSAAQGGRGLANTIDNDIARLIINDSVNNRIGHVEDEINGNLIHKAVGLLDKSHAPDEDRHLVISQRQLDLLNEEFGERNLRFLYGVQISTSRNLPDNVCIIFQCGAFALCMQDDIRVQAAYDLDYMATCVVGDILYGVDLLRPEFTVMVRARD